MPYYHYHFGLEIIVEISCNNMFFSWQHTNFYWHVSAIYHNFKVFITAKVSFVFLYSKCDQKITVLTLKSVLISRFLAKPTRWKITTSSHLDYLLLGVNITQYVYIYVSSYLLLKSICISVAQINYKFCLFILIITELGTRRKAFWIKVI